MDNNLELELQNLKEETVISQQKDKDQNNQKYHSNSNYKKDLTSIIFLIYLYYCWSFSSIWNRSYGWFEFKFGLLLFRPLPPLNANLPLAF